MKTLLPLLLFVLSLHVFGQNVGINHNDEVPYGSSILDIRSATKGLLIPRHSTASKLAITSPDSGLIILDTTIWCVSIYNGASWFDLCANNTGSCPPGFVRVPGRNYCIEVNERPFTDWNNANTICLSVGYRLCNPDEWRDACNFHLLTEDNTGSIIPLQNMDDNEEWTNDFASGIDVVVLGSGSCTYTNQVSISATSPRFRCCYTR